MPGVDVYSIIDYKVVKEKKKPEIEGKFSDEFYFQTYDPTYLCRYKVITPRDMDLKYLVVNPLQGVQLSPKVIHDGNKKIYLWEYKNIPQIIKEKSMPPADEVTFRILVTTMNSWEEFSNWWRNKIEAKTKANKLIKNEVAELTQNLSTPREKMEAIFRYVKAIRYVSIGLRKSGYEPENAQKVFENKYGDCKDQSTLLISMLRAAGFSAYYVLISTNDRGNLIKDFPYPFQFNHCIVPVESEAKYHFIDPVANVYRFDYLPDSDQNRDVLIFKDKKVVFEKTPLAISEENAYHSQSQIKIGVDGSIECEVKNFGVGRKEAINRIFFIDNKPTEIKELLEERVNDISSGARLLTYKHSDPMNFEKGFDLTIKYDAQDYCRKAGDILIFDVPEISEQCPAADKKDRRYPIVISNNYYRKDEAEFNVPEGHKVYYLPEPVEIKNQYFEFRSCYRQEGKRIIYEGELIRKAIRIAPEDYPVYKKLCEGVEKSFKRSVLFKKKNNG